MHRRAATLRNFAGARGQSLDTSATGDESTTLIDSSQQSLEDLLRRQLSEKEREIERLKAQIRAFQVQLEERPAVEVVSELKKAHDELAILLEGTQRENERCMGDLARSKEREKGLEKELEKLLGDDWRTKLDVQSPSSIPLRSGGLIRGQPGASNSLTSLVSPALGPSGATANIDTAAHIEQVRLLILGMEQRLQVREEKLEKTLERAQTEGLKFQELRKELTSTST